MLLVFAFLAGCSPYVMPDSENPENSMLMKIECRDDLTLRNSVVQVLRSARAREISVSSTGGMLDIQATWLFWDTPPYKVQSVEEELTRMPGVIYVNVEKTVHMVVSGSEHRL